MEIPLFWLSPSGFQGNSAGRCGGVLFVYIKVRLVVVTSNFSNNTAKQGGGGVRLVTPWHAELVEDLQKSFKKISVSGIGPLCWTGVIKCRRLVLVLMYTFISNLVLRLSAMTMFTLAMLPLHIKVSPYKDKRANQVFSFSLCATIFLGLLNLIKAMAVEGLVDYGTVRSILEACDTLTDSILLWWPLTIILVYALFLVLKKVFSKRKAKDCCSKYFRKSSPVENIELQERDKNTQSRKRRDSI